MIRLIKIGFFAALLTILIAVLIPLVTKSSNNNNSRSNTSSVNTDMMDIMQNTAENPRFYGVDSHNQPYSIQAQSAVQLVDKKLELNQVFANYTLKDNKLISIVGDKAKLDSEGSIVNIDGNIVIMYEDLYALNAQKAELNYKDGLASGNSKVELISKFGKVESNNFEVKENYSDIRFFGNRVKTTLYPNETQNEKQ
jgi:lipopolysaccharide export system protein LptC